MKKIMAWVLSLVLVLSLNGVLAESFSLEQLDNVEFIFCSGAGAWSTELFISGDGSFSGFYSDSEMGDAGDDYPEGTVYYCSFEGSVELVEQVDEYTVKLKVAEMYCQEETEPSIENGIRYVPTTPYGLENAGELELYLPGKPVAELSEDFLLWAMMDLSENAETLSFYGLYNPVDQTGFVGYEQDYANYVLALDAGLDLEDLPENCQLVVSLEENSLVGEYLNVEVWTEERFSREQLLSLQPGDYLLAMDELFTVETVTEEDGEILVNGGYFEGTGVTLWQVEDGIYQPVLENDAVTYAYQGEALLTLGEQVTLSLYTFNEDGELLDDMETQTVPAAGFSALLDDAAARYPELIGSLVDLRLEGGKVVEIVLNYRP